MRTFYGFVSMAMLSLSPGLLADSPYREGNGWHGIVGLGLLAKTEPYIEEDARILPIPYLIMRQGKFFIEGLKVGLRTLEGSSGHFDIILSPRLEGFDADDNVYFSGMENRDFSLDGGLATKLRQGMVELNFSVVTDLLDKSDGQEISASMGHTYIALNRNATVTPSLGLKWQSSDLVNYYYGVQPHEATLTRPAYTGKATLNYTAGLRVTYLLGKRSSLVGGIEYEHLGERIVDSPLLDEKQVVKFFMGYGWQF